MSNRTRKRAHKAAVATDIGTGIVAARVRAIALARRAAGGEDLLGGAIADARDNIDAANAHLLNGDQEAAREALQLAQEQLDTAEQRAPS